MKRKFVLLIFFFCFLLGACTDKEYDRLKNEGYTLFKGEEYDKALSDFERAKERNNNDEINNDIFITKEMIKSINTFNKGNFESVLIYIGEIKETKDESLKTIAISKLAELEKETNELKETKQTIEQKLKEAEIQLNNKKFDDANQSLIAVLDLIPKHSSFAQYANQTKDLLGKVEDERGKVIAAANEVKKKEEEQNKNQEEKKKQESEQGTTGQQQDTNQYQQQNPMNPDKAVVYIANNEGIHLHANIIGEYKFTNEKGEYVILYTFNEGPSNVVHKTYNINPYTKVYYKTN
ncbi:hypothetical protein [Ectobacillus polymachus]|uniref:hypothetical protein n=1 Tax=Ectobacillus polymachus TaxID=1508806 RepID=UPI003A8B10BF